MPLDSDQMDELKKLIAVSRKRALNFGICLGGKPETTILFLHRMRSADVLMREAKKAGDSTKTACGTVQTKGKILSLTCLDKPPAKLARTTKLFLAKLGMKMTVKVLDRDGGVIDEDVDEDDTDEGATPEAETVDPLAAKWAAAEAKYADVIARAASDGSVLDPSKLRADWAYAQGIAAEEDYSGALKVLARLVTLIEADEGVSHSAAATFEERSQKLSKPVEAALKGRAGPYEKIRLLWTYAHEKAQESPPDHTSANKALNSLVGLLKEAAAALKGNKGAGDKPEGVKDGTVAKEVRKRDDLTALLKEVKALQPEITRLMQLPPETARIVQSQRALTGLQKRLSIDAKQADIAPAQATVAGIKAAIAVLKAEEPGISRAVGLREQAEREYAALAANLTKARYIYAVTAAFERDVKAFKEADVYVRAAMKNKNWAETLAKMPALEAAMKRLNARKAEFDQIVKDEAAAEAAFEKLAPLVADAEFTPITTPAAQEWDAKLQAALERCEQAGSAKDWKTFLATLPDVEEAARALSDLYDECDALVDFEAELDAAFQKVDQRLKAVLKTKAVLPAFIALRQQASALRAAFIETFEQIADLEEAKRILGQLEKLAPKAEALAQENAAARARRRAFEKDRKAAARTFKAAFAFKPNTKDALALFDAFKADFTKMQAAFDAGDEGFPDLLETAKEHAAALASAKAENDAGAAKAEQAAAQRKPDLIAALRASRQLIALHAPLLDHFTDMLNTLNTAAGTAFIDQRWAELDARVTELEAVIAEISAATAKAAPATKELKSEVEARWNPDFQAQVQDVKAYDRDATAMMGADLDEIEKLEADFLKCLGATQWSRCKACLDQLEPRVLAKFAFKPEHDRFVADKAWVSAELAKIKSRLRAVSKMEEVTRDIKQVKSSLNDRVSLRRAKIRHLDYAAARAEMPDIIKELETLEGLKADHDAALAKKKLADKAWIKMARRYDIVKDFKGYTPALAKLVRAFSEANASFDAVYFAFDYDEAVRRAPRLSQAINDLYAKAAEHQAAAAGAAKRAANALKTLKSASVEKIAKLPSEKQVALLDQLRAERGALSPEQRAQQCKIYAAMDLDPEFKEADDARRDALATAMREDTELMAAKDNWADTPIPDRIRLLERTLKKECEIYGMPVPVVNTYSEDSSVQGYFSPADNSVNLNVHPNADFHDFYECIDTIVHENAHNYQEHLVTQLREGLISPSDRDYKQAVMFAANSGPGDYVNASEDEYVYNKQPLEEHAWATGGGIAAAFQKSEA
ncbi:MAG: hypothetical protein AAGA08_08380 [Pseudomonadota bacterium]